MVSEKMANPARTEGGMVGATREKYPLFVQYGNTPGRFHRLPLVLGVPENGNPWTKAEIEEALGAPLATFRQFLDDIFVGRPTPQRPSRAS
jgi:hypothetical protein